MKLECEQCQGEFDGNRGYRFCSPLCREINHNRKLAEAWVAREPYKPTAEHRKRFGNSHAYTKKDQEHLKKYQRVRG